MEGFARALDRLKAEIVKGEPDPKDLFIALFETLDWLVSAKVEDQLTGVVQEKAKGIRYARNRVNHQWADALKLQDMPFPTVLTNLAGGSRVIHPPVVKMWCWKPIAQLPPPDPRFPGTDIEPFYQQHLEGKLALEALDAIVGAMPTT